MTNHEFLLVIILLLFLFMIIFVWISKRKSDSKSKEFQLWFEKQESSWLQQKASFEERILNLQQYQKVLQNEKESLLVQLTKSEADVRFLKEKQKNDIENLEVTQQKFQIAFENLAQKILDEKTTKFTAQNLENMQSILLPLQDKIHLFEKKVESTHKESIDYHAALREQIMGLKKTNELMSQETINLTKALKGDSKVQGNWGELILETVLEKSGLTKNREYFVQPVLMHDDGQKLQPDVVIHLPDGKRMVVDAKVSLTAYEKYVNESDVSFQKQHVKEHLISFKKHIEGLSQKNYWDLYQVESPNFVLMFVPIESAFALALQQDNTLYNRAFEKNIVIVTPTTLLATLKTIESMWTHQKQQENAMEIARQAGALFDKFQNFVLDLQKVGKKMEETQTVYDAAMNKLVEGKGNLIRSAEKLKKMGALTKKDLPTDLIQKSQNDL
jgi:DNA recombination protein RmuC